jgi:hypothetical protein
MRGEEAMSEPAPGFTPMRSDIAIVLRSPEGPGPREASSSGADAAQHEQGPARERGGGRAFDGPNG